ncbi:hypothetical protein [Methylocaldum szegediense]|jgi:hypothetical protein|uniref:Transposase n=1 Tax=Methylocaldum szegediense TaxID=73780 RepID=A0ABM9I4W6_9GAMM|nr:hypothetical protein [Methylocaldum szegediense]CAI8895168.1 protein of unknown function [Methylocaldum szegediense]
MAIQDTQLVRTGVRISRLAAPKSRRQGSDYQLAYPGATGLHLHALKIKLTRKIFDMLDDIWPSPSCEASEAYA